MEQLVLKQEILDSMKKDPMLSGKVGHILGISTMTLPKMIMLNDRRLTQASVLKIIREHLGFTTDNELLTSEPEKVDG